MPDTSTTRRVIHHPPDSTGPRETDDHLAVEQPLEIRIGDAPLSITMRTPGSPGHDEELAAGFCLTEAIVRSRDELIGVAPCPTAEFGNLVRVHVAAAAHDRIARAQRTRFMSSSCGICGKQSIDRVEQAIPPLRGDFTVRPDTLCALPDRLRDAQATFASTGGLHAAGLFTPEGELIVLREDVGRHNAVDKVIGRMLLDDRIPIDPAILLVSGRSSFEIMQKAAMAGIAFVAAVSAPSSLAVDFAEQVGQTLVGFLRPPRFNIYAGASRIME